MTEIDRLISLNKKAYDKGYRGMSLVTPGTIVLSPDYEKKCLNCGAAVLQYWLRTKGIILVVRPFKLNEDGSVCFDYYVSNSNGTITDAFERGADQWGYEDAILAGLEKIIEKL